MPDAIQLPPYAPRECACMAVAFEYITGESRGKITGHPKYKIEKGGLNWKLFSEIAVDLGFQTRLLYTALAVDDSSDDGIGELVDMATLRAAISQYPAIVAERHLHNIMGDKFTTEHALAYVGELQLDPAFGCDHPSRRRDIIGAVVFPGLTIGECLERIREMSRRHAQGPSPTQGTPQ